MLRLISLAFILTCCIGSCSDRNINEPAYDALFSNLEYSNKFIEQQNEIVRHTLERKIYEPATRAKAEFWISKVDTIRYLCSDLVNKIHQLSEKDLNENDLKLLTQKFRRNLFVIDSGIMQQITNQIEKISFGSNKENSSVNFRVSNMSKPMQRLYLLSMVQQVRILENTMTTLCLENSTNHIFYFDFFSAIIGQNSTVVEPLDTIIINAGLGAFTNKGNPSFFIDGNKVEMDEMATANYSFKAPSRPGNYKVPIQILFTDVDGKKQSISKMVEYKVKL